MECIVIKAKAKVKYSYLILLTGSEKYNTRSEKVIFVL